MSKKRQSYSGEYKGKVALDALSGLKTLAQLSASRLTPARPGQCQAPGADNPMLQQPAPDRLRHPQPHRRRKPPYLPRGPSTPPTTMAAGCSTPARWASSCPAGWAPPTTASSSPTTSPNTWDEQGGMGQIRDFKTLYSLGKRWGIGPEGPRCACCAAMGGDAASDYEWPCPIMGGWICETHCAEVQMKDYPDGRAAIPADARMGKSDPELLEACSRCDYGYKPSAMTLKHEDVVGLEFDFIVVDSMQCLGVFCSFGAGDIPLKLLNELGEPPLHEQFLADSPIVTCARKSLANKLASWVFHKDHYEDVAQKGYYVYEYSARTRKYQRLSCPEKPKLLAAVEKELDKYIINLSSRNLSFRKAKSISLKEFTPC